MNISVILPTYNRAEKLLDTLDSFAQQTYPRDQFEIILVDDGSTVEMSSCLTRDYPFPLVILRQENQGDAAARNTGARRSNREALVFVDDDITVVPQFLEQIVKTLHRRPRQVVVGNLLPPSGKDPLIQYFDEIQVQRLQDEQDIPFTRCLSGFMAVRRQDYFEIGMMQSLTGKGPDAWCDVDFAYRAWLLGFQFVRSLHAIGYHHDPAATDISLFCRRLERASRSAVLLFQKYPGLEKHLVMFEDKSPVSLGHDSPATILRKLGHTLTAYRSIQKGMEKTLEIMERRHVVRAVRQPLYRWISSSYIYRGYRMGLRENNRMQGNT